MGDGAVRDEVIHLTSLDEDFCRRLETEIMATEFQVKEPSPEDAAQPRWAVTTDYGETFRAIILDGPEAMGSGPSDLVEATRKVTGLREVVPFRVQANVMLPGQGLGRHTDVPEFRGARRWSFPDWLLVAMLHSGLYDAEQIRIINVLVWPTSTGAGDLRVFDRSNRSLLASFTPAPRSAVVFDSCRLPHEVFAIPGDEVAVGPGDRIGYETSSRWLLRRTDGSTVSLSRDETRISTLVKLACFADEADRDAYLTGPEESLDTAQVIATLTRHLPPDVQELAAESRQHLVDHLVSYM